MMRRLLAALAVCALAAATTTVALATTRGDEADQGPTPTSESGTTKVLAVPGDQAASFAVLRRPVTADDGIDTDATGPFGANLRLARKVSTAASAVWVVPAQDHICLRAEDATGAAWTCVPTAEAAKGRLVLTLRPARTLEATALFALLPDGASDAHLTTTSGDSGLHVEENVASATDTNATALSFVNGNDQSQVIPVP